ncbi:hypothetical protein ES705_14742 [subsurface metagenome]
MTEKKKTSFKIISGMKFYIPSDLAKILDLTEFTIRYYLRQKKLKGVRLGGRWYISEANLKSFLGGGRFFDQPDDVIMDQINQAIKLTFEANVEWLAHRVKELIITDLTKNITEKLIKVDQINVKSTEFESKEKTAERIRKTEKVKKDFVESKQL